MDLHFQSLQGTLFQAEVNFALWEELRKAQAQAALVRIMNGYSLFFLSVERALFGSVVIHLYSALETRNDTYNLGTLLQEVERERRDLDFTPWRTQLADLRPTWRKVSILRNEAVGHVTSRRQMREAFLHAALSPKELKEFMATVQRFVRTLSEAARGSSMLFGYGAHHDYRVQALIKRLGANHAFQPTRLAPRG